MMKQRSKFLTSIGMALVFCLMCVLAACTSPITLTMKEATAEVFVGSTTKLTVEYSRELTDKETVEWTSDNTAVATVSNGTVKGVSAGTAKITASVGDASATATVTVKEKRTISGLDATATIDLDAGQTTVQLSATCSDGGAIEWASKDTSIATVDQNGLVTAVKKDARSVSVEITATRGEATASCTVTIKKDSAPVSYELTNGNSNAAVANNPDVWYYFFKTSDGATSVISSAQFTSENGNDKLVLSYYNASETNTSGKDAEDYIRYQPVFAEGTAYTVSFTFTSNTAGRIEIGQNKFEVAENETINVVAGATVAASMPLNIRIYIFGGTEEEPVTLTLDKITFTEGTPTTPVDPDQPVVPVEPTGPDYAIDPASASTTLDATNINNKNFFDPEKWTDFTANNSENENAKPVKQDDGSLQFAPKTMSRFDLFMGDVDGNGTMKSIVDKGDNLKDADGNAITWFYGKAFEYNFTMKADGNFSLMLFATNGAKPNPTNGDHRAVTLAFDVDAGSFTIRQSGSGTTDYVQAMGKGFTWDKAGENTLKITVTRFDLTRIILRFEINGQKIVMSGTPESGVGFIYGGNYVDTIDTQTGGYGQRFNVVTGENTTLTINQLAIKRYDADPITEFVFPTITFTTADIEATNDKAYLVINGTYEGAKTADELKGYLQFDLQANNFNSWKRYLTDSSLYTVTLGANGTFTLKVELNTLPDNGMYIAHGGIMGKSDLTLPSAEGTQDGKQVTVGEKTYTLVYKHGGAGDSSLNFGCVGVTVADKA